ncbi:asparagine synthase [Kineobactrum salinum]|uniref:asparagine synthase (glutamine-hydrolyzing) n=1 Tax=Kineobactrum salinum TaxID=2708301 RepID=A0A6C0U5S9_9GAMM|nr:asparagine synthase [Kineobactrum salinum]
MTVLGEHAADIAEDEASIAIVLGRLRPYGEDYGLEHPAQWLLNCLQRQGEDFYPALAGFFAVVVLDKSSGEMRLVSDHVGSVPLYFCPRGNQWWVADSLRLLEPQLRPEDAPLAPQALYDYCFHHCVPAPGTVYEDVVKLEPGAELTVDITGASRSRNLYQPAYDYSVESAETLMARCRELIATAVARNIAPGAGAFLSGGLDSSTVAGMFAQQQPEAPTFSIGFDAKGYDETAYARITARHFNTRHHEHYLQPQEIIDHFVAVAGYFDEPFGNSSAMAAYTCARVAREHGITVMLAGDGGDEIFGGNERYAKQKVFEAWSAFPAPARKLAGAALATGLGRLPLLQKGRSYIEQANVTLPDRMDSYNFLNRFDPGIMFEQSFLAQVDTELPREGKRRRYQQCLAPDAVEKMMYLDWKYTLANNDLVKVSRMCRKAGVEVRYPLFEKEVVDFSCTVPARLKLPGGKLRDFYKRSFRGFLPDETLAKSKHGFGLPFGVWMKQEPELRKLTRDTLERLKLRGIFRADFIDTALDTHESGHSGYYGELIWIMVVLELWLTDRGR